MNIVPAFLNKLTYFLDDLIVRFPDEGELKKINNAISITKNVAPVTIVEKFMQFVAPWYIHVFDEDDTFFLELDLNENIDVNDNVTKNHYITIAKHLKSVWKDELCQKDKTNIWRHFQVLLTLGASYNKYLHIIYYANWVDLSKKNKPQADDANIKYHIELKNFLSNGGDIY